MKKLKVLIISNEVWNDKIHGNNVLSNWFEGLGDEIEFANIYCSPGNPSNIVCDRYFQITDSMMVKSVFGEKAGNSFVLKQKNEWSNTITKKVEKEPKFYGLFRSISHKTEMYIILFKLIV